MVKHGKTILLWVQIEGLNICRIIFVSYIMDSVFLKMQQSWLRAWALMWPPKKGDPGGQQQVGMGCFLKAKIARLLYLEPFSGLFGVFLSFSYVTFAKQNLGVALKLHF